MRAVSWRAKAVRVAIFLAIPVLGAGLIYLLRPLDGYDGWFLSQLALKEDTVYAPGYSDEAFRMVRVGMSQLEVRSLLGEPLDVYGPGARRDDVVGWRYSKSAGGASYRIRTVHFQSERVVRVSSRFYLD